MRCQAKHPTQGTQCGLPANHAGAHSNGTICHPWRDPLCGNIYLPAKYKCELPPNHEGPHQYLIGQTNQFCWLDQPKPVSEYEVKVEFKPYAPLKIPFSGE